MSQVNLIDKAQKYLNQLCFEIQGRCVGSEGNKAAAKLFTQTMQSFGFEIKQSEFDCFDWNQDGAVLQVDDTTFEALVSPYSLACSLNAPLCTVSNFNELESVEAEGKIVLLKGDIANEQLMPKNFPFYNPDEHQKIIHLLESRGFKAVVTATSHNQEMAGGVYPFPLIEDGDFTLPSVYMTDVEGERLAAFEGKKVSLEITALRKPSKGCNVISRKGNKDAERIVVFAHIDSKQGSPGAIDNAAGISILLLLGELLTNYNKDFLIEITALNGEDYYSNPGEILYLNNNKDNFSNIYLGINIDGAGYHKGNTAYSLYDCPWEIEAKVKKVFSSETGIIEGEPWYQGDHSLFLMNQRPALALTSECVMELLAIAHTPKDNLDIVDSSKLVDTANALYKLINEL